MTFQNLWFGEACCFYNMAISNTLDFWLHIFMFLILEMCFTSLDWMSVRGRIKDVHLCVRIVTSNTTHADICLGCIENSQWQSSCQTCVCSSSTFVSPISSLMSFSNVNPVPNVPLKFMAFKTRYVCLRARMHTRVRVCICFTYVTPCVISLLINVEVLKVLSVDLITHKPFSNLPSRLSSVVLRSIVKLTQTNYTLGPAPNGQIGKQEEREGCWKLHSVLLQGFRASHAAGQCLGLRLSASTSGNQLKDNSLKTRQTLICVTVLHPYSHIYAPAASHARIKFLCLEPPGQKCVACWHKGRSEQQGASCRQAILVFPVSLQAYSGLMFHVRIGAYVTMGRPGS